MERNISKIAIHSAIYSHIGKVISTIFILLTFIIIIRYLCVDDYGMYAIYVNAIFFAAIFLDFGAAEVILRYVPEYIQKDNISFIKALIGRSVFICSVGAAVIGSAIFLVRAIFPCVGEGHKLFTYLHYIVIFGWFRILREVLGNVLNGFFYQKYRITSEILISALRFILIFIFIGRGIDAWGIVIIYALTDLIIMSLFCLRMIKPFRQPSDARNMHGGFSRMFKFGLNEYFYKLFWFFTDNRFDIYIVGFSLGMTAAGYLAFAAGIMNFLLDWSPGFIIRPVVGPLFIREYTAKKDLSRIMYFFKLHNKFLVFIALPLFLFIGIMLDKIIVYVFDPKYLPSLHAFFIMLAGMFFINILIPLRNMVSLIERPDISNLSNCVAIPKVVLMLVFAKLAGIEGAALVYIVSLFLIIAIHLVLINRVVKLQYPWRAFFKIAQNAFIMGVAVFFLRAFAQDRFSLGCVSVLGVVIYVAAALTNKAFSADEREIFNRAFKVKLWNF